MEGTMRISDGEMEAAREEVRLRREGECYGIGRDGGQDRLRTDGLLDLR